MRSSTRPAASVVMALGTGLLIGSVSFELIDEALKTRKVAAVALSAIAAAGGYALLDPESGTTGALVQGFAAGALLAMLADTLLPEAYAVEGVLTGSLVVVGFAISLALSAL